MQCKKRLSRRGKWYIALAAFMLIMAREGCVDQNLDIGHPGTPICPQPGCK